jgi:hypothetical protein
MKARLLVLALCAAAGCGDDDTTNPGGLDMAVSQFPAVPTLGVEIDRMGRPAINTALVHAFDPVDGTKNAAKDKYNAEGNPANWATTAAFGGEYLNELAKNLAILDALDGVCGNQLLAMGSGADAAASSYNTLATLLLDDQLYIDTSIVTCAPVTLGTQRVPNYLAVEARYALGPIGAGGLGLNPTVSALFGGCGGRTPLDDVIDVTYSFLGKGLDGVITDGVDQDADPMPGASLTEFPFLSAPN